MADAMLTRRDRLARLIEHRLRSVRNSSGYDHTARQIADDMLARMPVTAAAIDMMAYYENLCGQLRVERDALRAQWEAKQARGAA